MAVNTPHFKIRLPPELKERLEHAARQSRLSLTAEIVSRLERSFDSIENEMWTTRSDEMHRIQVEIESLKAIANSGEITEEFAAHVRAKVAHLKRLLRGVASQLEFLRKVGTSDEPEDIVEPYPEERERSGEK